MSTAVPAISLDPLKLLANAGLSRLVLTAKLKPVSGNRFQPANFPEVGHVIYAAPHPDGQVEQTCIVDSAASMANHLESVCFASRFSSEPHPDLEGLPYVKWLEAPNGDLLATSLTEPHRLASQHLTKEAALDNQLFGDVLIREFGMTKKKSKDDKNRTHPLPNQWWSIFATIFKYDPNSLVHGAMFPNLSIKIARLLTASHEAFAAARVGYSGIKFDPFDTEKSVQPIFAVDEETATEIRAVFVIDLGLLRSFGGNGKGLNEEQKAMLLRLAFWKIGRLFSQPFRFRSNCDLQLVSLHLGDGALSCASLMAGMTEAIKAAYAGRTEPAITETVKTEPAITETEKKPGKKRSKQHDAGEGNSDGGGEQAEEDEDEGE